MATAWLPANKVYGNPWDVDPVEAAEQEAIDEKFANDDYFIIDVQSHFTNGYAIGFRDSEFVKNMGIKERNPQIDNVYVEIGSAFGRLALEHPVMAQHLMGKNIKFYGSDHVIWGTDCLRWGSPQSVVDAFKRFQISDELCEKHGYTKITKQDKANIFGLIAAKLYGIDVEQKRKEIPRDGINQFKLKYQAMGGQPSNSVPGWVRDDTRAARA